MLSMCAEDWAMSFEMWFSLWEMEEMNRLTVQAGSWPSWCPFRDDRHQGMLYCHLPHSCHINANTTADNAVIQWDAGEVVYVFSNIIDYICCAYFKAVRIGSLRQQSESFCRFQRQNFRQWDFLKWKKKFTFCVDYQHIKIQHELYLISLWYQLLPFTTCFLYKQKGSCNLKLCDTDDCWW